MSDDDLPIDLPVPTREKTEVVIPLDRADDAEVARRNTHALIAAAADAVREMGEIAWTSQSARAYEVLGQLIEKSLAANERLLEIEKKRRELDGDTGPRTINNTLVLTGAEALDLVKRRMRDK